MIEICLLYHALEPNLFPMCHTFLRGEWSLVIQNKC